MGIICNYRISCFIKARLLNNNLRNGFSSAGTISFSALGREKEESQIEVCWRSLASWCSASEEIQSRGETTSDSAVNVAERNEQLKSQAEKVNWVKSNLVQKIAVKKGGAQTRAFLFNFISKLEVFGSFV